MHVKMRTQQTDYEKYWGNSLKPPTVFEIGF